MPYELKPGQGQLFRNHEKKEDRHPNVKGNAMLDASAVRQYLAEHPDATTIPLELAAWTKESDRAGKWLSLSVKLKQDSDSTQSRSGGGREQFNKRVQEVGSDIDAACGDKPEDSDISF
jgi:hypothetical protein